MACSGGDRRQRRKQGAKAGAAASRMQGESRRRRWEPQPVFVSEEKAPQWPVPALYKSASCDVSHCGRRVLRYKITVPCHRRGRMDKGMNFFYILSGPLGYVMEWIYKLLPSYGWDIILFTLLINIVKIPLQLSQQKSMAKMSAFQPMLLDIQNKYKNKPEKQQEEMLKLQQDYGYSPTAGCVPMLLNFLVMFGVIGVVYNPLERIFHISAAALTAAGEALTASGVTFTAITRDTTIISQLIAGGNSALAGCFTAEQIATITEFSQHMTFLGIDLTRVPKIGLSLDIVLPLLSVITMFLSTHISMKASGQQMQGSMKLTMYMMPLMYLFFCFTYPLAFSLYYVISNIVMTVQTQIMRKVYDPEKMRKEVEAQIAEKRKQEKRGVKNTTVKVTDPKTGKVTEKNLSASEMNKRRLEYARQLDAERYKDERTVPLSELNKQDKE